jgi:hypothetical protein
MQTRGLQLKRLQEEPKGARTLRKMPKQLPKKEEPRPEEKTKMLLKLLWWLSILT